MSKIFWLFFLENVCLMRGRFFFKEFDVRVKIVFFDNYVIFNVFIMGVLVFMLCIIDVLFLVGIFLRILGEFVSYL